MRSLVAGIWEFVVGDDWRLALGVVLALGATAVAAALAFPAWWVAPLVVVLFLIASLLRADRRASASRR